MQRAHSRCPASAVARKSPRRYNAWNRKIFSPPFFPTNWPVPKISWATASCRTIRFVQQTIEDWSRRGDGHRRQWNIFCAGLKRVRFNVSPATCPNPSSAGFGNPQRPSVRVSRHRALGRTSHSRQCKTRQAASAIPPAKTNLAFSTPQPSSVFAKKPGPRRKTQMNCTMPFSN